MAVSSAERINLLGMLWYHGSKSQREAETSLEQCSGDCCYMIREQRGSLFLSTRYKDMYNHLLIHFTREGYVLDGHHNGFRRLQELVKHHQQHSVYVEGGEFTLQACCHKDYNAITMRYINDFNGPCVIQVREDCLIIKRSNGTGKEIGRWPYAFIRKFRFDDERSQFSFTSGRRGVFGLADYLFRLHNRTYFNLRDTVNTIANGRSGCGGDQAPPPTTSQSPPPPVPPHSKNSSFHKKQDANRSEENAYLGLPAVRSVRPQRSTSFPDLTEALLKAELTPYRSSLGGSTKSVASEPTPSKSTSSSTKSTKSQRSSTSSPSEPNSPLLSTKVSSRDYQIPRPVTENIYNVPRPSHDSRNDYSVPRPVEETYMVPRPGIRRSGASDSVLPLLTGRRKMSLPAAHLEHRYEDPDNMNS